MKRLINFFKKLFGCEEVCPKCKSNPCKCELEVPAEHIRVIKEASTNDVHEKPVTVKFPTTEVIDCPSDKLPKVKKEVKKVEEKEEAPKKKRAPRKKKVDTEKK